MVEPWVYDGPCAEDEEGNDVDPVGSAGERLGGRRKRRDGERERSLAIEGEERDGEAEEHEAEGD